MDKESKLIIGTSDTDFPETILNGLLPYNIYLYWFDPNLAGSQYINTVPFSHAYSLISAQYAPYLDETDLKLIEIPYDKERYAWTGTGDPKVYRINTINNFSQTHPGTKEKKLGQFTAYAPTKTIGGIRNWRNESKLYNYPYSLAYLYDGLGEPIEIKYENCNSNTNEVYTRLALNINGDYSLYIKDYLGDTNGQMQQNVITSSRDYPCSSSQYASWLSTNKNSIQATKTNTIVGSMTNLATSALGAAAIGGMVGGPIGAAVGGVGGVAVGVASSIVSGISNIFQTQNAMLGQEKDMRNLPQSLISKGSDITLGMNTTEQKLNLYRYRQKDEYMQKIGDFFAMYGYKQNRLMQPNIRDRHYYNFMKTVGCNIETTNNIPLYAVDVIKAIFDKGTTVWHVDRQGVTVADYSKDNNEV